METSDQSVRDLLAANIKRARADRGLSLSELSRRSSIGKATLSQLESGAGNPTIETVFSLSRALELPISDLLEGGRGEMTVVRGDEQEVLAGEAVELRLLRRIEDGGLIVEVYDQRVRGTARQRSLGHVGTEHTIVQAGKLRVEVGDSAAELGPGDSVAFDASIPHSYQAIGGEVRSVLLLQYRGTGPHVC
ncbi:helix-turn-helix domain-containing protein [Amycolatopsis albispora]|uniref:XRE family transcriptional regulator n=1 Tax=Amycolatopsis albispora TaxID=1804986 RepID=A0A344L2P6_9PSEU|nr:XRE family transcriptional regulator [Amycolatopsis albispora]AXB42320.1 XRE family transcriptional regulator [Amycolatopsis albispora]